MTTRYGGETPLIGVGGLTLTVEAPTGTTEAAPVNAGEVFKLGGAAADSSGYKAAALAATDGPATCVMVVALERATAVEPMSVRVLGRYSQVRRIPYEGSPSLGQSINAGTTSQKKVEGVTFADGAGFIAKIDATAAEVEVII